MYNKPVAYFVTACIQGNTGRQMHDPNLPEARILIEGIRSERNAPGLMQLEDSLQ
jgi:hypothetical protein